MQYSSGTLHPGLTNYAKDIFIELGFFNRKLL